MNLYAVNTYCSDIPIRVEKQGYYILKENQTGDYIRGKFPKWLKSKYSINNVGFVSTRDYYFGENDEFKIAIIGDSFVEGFQVDSKKSIGRLLEKKQLEYEVYELGFSGYNFHNYVELYEKFSLDNFKYVFIIIDIQDLKALRAEKIKFTDAIKVKEMIFRNLYNNFYFFKYLNWNHAIVSKTIGILDNFKLQKQTDIDYVDITSFMQENTNVFLVLKSENDSILKTVYPNLDFIDIKHTRIPFDFGYDQHWNLNGKYNVAETLVKWINQQKR